MYLFLIHTHVMPRKPAFFQVEFNRFKFQTIKRFEIYKNDIFDYIFKQHYKIKLSKI